MGIFDGSWYNPAGFIGRAGDLKRYAGSKTGSLMSGRAILQGGPKEQNMESARTFDVFGSPATAGTKQQSTARLGALLYGAAMGLGALGAGSAAGSAGGGTGSAGGTLGGSSGGLGGLGGGTAQGGGSATTGGMSPLQMLNWGRRGYGAYNMLRGMGGGGQQQAGYGGGGMPMRQPQYGPQQQRPLPGSGPFDWLKL